MNPRGNLSGSAATLMQAVKELRHEWEQTQHSWRDAKAAEFERRFLENLPNDAARVVVVMKELAAILKKIHAECE